MKHTLKSFLFFAFGVLLVSSFCGFAVVKAEILTVNLKAPEFHLDTNINGQHVIETDDFGNLLRPGKPELPARVFMIALPPGAEVISVDIRPTGWIEEYENIKIAPAPPALPNSEDPEMVENCLANWQEDYNKTYSSDEPYPQVSGEYLGTGGLRKYTFARVAFFPFTYNPVSGKLTYNSSVIGYQSRQTCFEVIR